MLNDLQNSEYSILVSKFVAQIFRRFKVVIAEILNPLNSTNILEMIF